MGVIDKEWLREKFSDTNKAFWMRFKTTKAYKSIE